MDFIEDNDEMQQELEPDEERIPRPGEVNLYCVNPMIIQANCRLLFSGLLGYDAMRAISNERKSMKVLR